MNGPQRLWPMSLEAMLRHFVLSLRIPSTSLRCRDPRVQTPTGHYRSGLTFPVKLCHRHRPLMKRAISSALRGENSFQLTDTPTPRWSCKYQ